MGVEWTRRALRAVDGIADFLAQDDPAAARRAVQRVEKAVSFLASQPSMGRPGRVTGSRELVVSNTPFIVPYRVRGERIEILAVLHSARKWPDGF